MSSSILRKTASYLSVTSVTSKSTIFQRLRAPISQATRSVSTARVYSQSSSFKPHTMPESATSGPLERTITSKITSNFQPTYLSIHNDSHLHSHHAAMKGSTSPETHFRMTVVSAAFEGKMQPARHRMIYALLKEEMAQQGGLHALQLVTRTPKELAQKEKEVNDKIDAEERARAEAEASS